MEIAKFASFNCMIHSKESLHFMKVVLSDNLRSVLIIKINFKIIVMDRIVL